MNPRRVLASSTAIIFAVSFLLPAYTPYNGFNCFMLCWGGLIKFPPEKWGAWLYYGGFAVSNILFVGFLALAFARKTFSKACIVLISIMGLHVLSWLVLNLVWDGWKTAIRIGYFVWLLAYILQTYACIKYRKTSGVVG
jgi:hypothetical protein